MIVDSDVIIEILRGNPRTIRWLVSQRAGATRLRCSPVTRAEIRAGARPGELVHISAFLTTFDLVSIEGSTGDLAGEQLAKFSRSHGVQLGDALIAASAIELRDDLATFNTKHFPGVQRVVVPDR